MDAPYICRACNIRQVRRPGARCLICAVAGTEQHGVRPLKLLLPAPPRRGGAYHDPERRE
jgi:hypothetical protein